MGIFALVFYIIFVATIGLIFWITRILKLYRQKNTRAVKRNLAVLGLLLLIAGWELRIILSANLDFKDQTEALTGKKFWCWNDFRYNEFGVRGEGFTFEVYNLNDEMAHYFSHPDKTFFEAFPHKEFGTAHWLATPITDTDFVNIMTPMYSEWSNRFQKKIGKRQSWVKNIAYSEGGYYAMGQEHGNNLYLIAPKDKLFIYINHNR